MDDIARWTLPDSKGRYTVQISNHYFSAQEFKTYLSSPCLGMLFLDLNFANVAGMLNDLRDVRLVSSTDFARHSFSQICESTIHPVFPENTNAIAEGCKVGLDHAECAVDGPEDEEDDKEVMGVPEALKVGTARFLRRCERNRHKRKQHDISTPTRSSGEVG